MGKALLVQFPYIRLLLNMAVLDQSKRDNPIFMVSEGGCCATGKQQQESDLSCSLWWQIWIIIFPQMPWMHHFGSAAGEDWLCTVGRRCSDGVGAVSPYIAYTQFRSSDKAQASPVQREWKSAFLLGPFPGSSVCMMHRAKWRDKMCNMSLFTSAFYSAL